MKVRLDSFTGEFYHSRKNYHLSFSNYSKKMQEEERPLSSLYKASIILISKPDDATKKENYSPISLMNINAKILNKKINKPDPVINVKDHAS